MTEGKNRKRRYVLGFWFDPSRQAMLLIEKSKPDWQRGLVNGLGGSIEPGERKVEAMIREFEEEAGVKTTLHQWTFIGVLDGGTWELNVFRGLGVLETFQEECDEGKLAFYQKMPPNMEATARWLYWLCLDTTTRGAKFEGII